MSQRLPLNGQCPEIPNPEGIGLFFGWDAPPRLPGGAHLHLPAWHRNNIFVILRSMTYTLTYYNESVQDDVLALPPGLRGRYFALTDRMELHGPNLGEPHSKAFGEGLFELRLKSAEGIARAFYCTLVNKRIVVLHSFVKKTDKTPVKDRRLAETRMKEVKNNADSR
ncbi:type II toxin-antitoxin system RelE/ParE family toxin [Pseudomonas sp. App30]|uniref:type II toxin-antitoxin system RelE/ParE family toxin n=1 Tax=Pseudomonas sp. App30 TaxID=3068990 RepID=UPI003A802EE3